MRISRPRTAWLSLLLALCATPVWAEGDLALHTVEDLSLGEPLFGRKITPAALKNRVVLLMPWSLADTQTVINIADMQNSYPHGEILLIANHTGTESMQEAAKAWKDKGGDTSGKIAVLHGCAFKGNKEPAPLGTLIFSITGKQVYPASKGQENQSVLFSDAIFSAVRFSGRGLKTSQALALGRAHDMFGDGMHQDLLKVAIALADPTRASDPSLQLLKGAALSKKNPILGGHAQNMIEAFDKAIAQEFTRATHLAQTDPPAAMAAMRQLTDWVPQKKEGKEAKAQIAQWMTDKSFVEELEADKMWLSLKAMGDKLDYEKNPRMKPLPQMEAHYAALRQKYPDTVAARKAKDAAQDWRLDPETGKYVPPAKNSAK